jgi:hypothetical protein
MAIVRPEGLGKSKQFNDLNLFDNAASIAYCVVSNIKMATEAYF